MEADNDIISYEAKTGKTVKINGEWKGRTAGGSFDNVTWRYNPQIFLKFASPLRLCYSYPLSNLTRLSRTAQVTITVSQPVQSGTYTGIGWYLLDCPTEERTAFSAWLVS